jgi:hypothetical protein
MPTGGTEWISMCVTRYWREETWVKVDGQWYLVAYSEVELWRSCYYVEYGWLME